MKHQDLFNSEMYLDMTAYFAIKNIEKNKKKRTPHDSNWEFRRGDVYLVNINTACNPFRHETRPMVVLQSNSSNYVCPTLLAAPVSSGYNAASDPNLSMHYYTGCVPGVKGTAAVLLEQITSVDKKLISRYLGKIDTERMNGINAVLEEGLGIVVPEDMEAP